ncbi:unnamed protein product [marine sediment metagenome]|uniref:Uncharacterized protein n=1 Tax=marine sediment metagenome TaxID=412755 RepID=X0Z9S2_9ZZZZ
MKKVGTHKRTESRVIGRKYKGEELEEGEYSWIIQGRKDKKQSVDWITSSFGVELDDWAWWDANWIYRTNISVTNQEAFTVYNHPLNLTFDTATLITATKMEADCSDIRMIDKWLVFAITGAYMGVTILAFFIRGSPVFLPIMVILITINSVIATFVSNAHHEILNSAPIIAAAVADWTFIDALIINLPVISFLYLVMLTVVMIAFGEQI